MWSFPERGECISLPVHNPAHCKQVWTALYLIPLWINTGRKWMWFYNDSPHTGSICCQRIHSKQFLLHMFTIFSCFKRYVSFLWVFPTLKLHLTRYISIWFTLSFIQLLFVFVLGKVIQLLFLILECHYLTFSCFISSFLVILCITYFCSSIFIRVKSKCLRSEFKPWSTAG